ncbi:hypothetical protein [Mesorhizobium sp. B4-1-3]|uniref:hypothetical protein n=1 Tax=Mesorhizobium sp. B4-1-3 TaxID=2589889 RepID=UPI0015E2B2B5|nr:hypothetical protein [Mesorhizobium sp. B4-1-3]
MVANFCPVQPGRAPFAPSLLVSLSASASTAQASQNHFLPTGNNCDSAGTGFGLPLEGEKDWGRTGGRMMNRIRNGGGLFEAAMVAVMALAAIGIILVIAVGVY